MANTKTNTIARTFAATGRGLIKDSTPFGAIAVTYPTAGWQVAVNGNTAKPLPAESAERIITHGLQIVQDAYAGSKTHADAKKAVEAKFEQIVEGDWKRVNAASSDPVTGRMRIILAKQIKAKNSEAYDKNLKGQDTADRNAYLDKVLANMEEKAEDNFAKLRTRAEAELEAERKMAEKTAELDIELDI